MRYAFCLVLALCFAAVPAKAQCPATGDTIVIGSLGDATNLISMLSTDSASHEMSGYVFSGLLKYDKDLNLVGDLARSWEISPDQRTITFYLRDDVRFHDGHPYTAHDALFTWRFMVDPNTPTAYSADYTRVTEAAALNDYTFQVTYEEPYSHALSSWTLPQLPRHLLEGKNPLETSLVRHPIGTGPYKFAEWKTGQYLHLVYNEDYFEGRPCLDGITYRIITDMATMFMELSAGGLDWAGLTPTQYQRQTDNQYFRKNFTKYKYLGDSYTFVGWNMKDPRFQDVRIRRALSYAIDRREIIDGVLLGLGQEATGPLKPGTLWHNPDVAIYPFNPEKALSLFAEAGWNIAKDGRLRNHKNEPFDFVLISNQGNITRQNAGIFIQYRLAQIGIKVDLRVIEWSSFISEFVNKGRFDAVLLGWTLPPDPGLHQIFHTNDGAAGKLNFTGYSNKELDELLTRELTTLKISERRALYARIQEILAEDQPYAFLYVPMSLPIIHSRFKNVEPTVAGLGHNFIHWYVPEEEQLRSKAPQGRNALEP